jgi:S1-C subfamily serine protease
MRVGAACVSLVLACAFLAPGWAFAAPVPGSQAQVGAWRIGAYTRGQTSVFSHCALDRVQANGFGVAVLFMGQGIWQLALEAVDWGLTPNETYVTTVTVGSGEPYTFTGTAVGPRVMTLRTAPEIFAQLKSGVQLKASANQKTYTISLDGIETATARMTDCFKQYSAPGAIPAMPAQPSAPTAASSPLVATIQTLLARLGYDPGPATGVVGLKTNMAISAFQKSLGEAGDGLPSEAVRAKLERAVAQRSGPSPNGTPPNTAAAPPGVPSSVPPGVPPAAKPPANAGSMSGTGFYIAADTIITNFHVINGCTEVRVRKNGVERGTARVVAQSQSDDLAALRTAVTSAESLKLRVGQPIKPAEAVLVFGYPLAGALSSTGNTTLGNVTALTGLRDDSRYLQISASVQPGNSGGPVLDEQGRLMGVVVSKLNALFVAQATGDVPQNVNFAIKVSTLVNFLEANKIAYEADSAPHELSNTQRAERAEASSTQLECRK